VTNAWWLRAPISAALLGLVLWRVPVTEVKDSLVRADASGLLAALAVYAVAVAARAARVRAFCRAAGAPLGYWAVLRIFFVGQLAYSVVPSVDAAYVGLLGAAGRNFTRAAVIVGLDRLSGTVAAFAIGMLALALRPDLASTLHPLAPLLVGTVFAGTLIGLLACFSPRIHAALWRAIPTPLREGNRWVAVIARKFLETLRGLADHKRAIPVSLGYALVFQLSMLAVFALLARALGLSLDAVALATVFPLMVLLGLVPSILGIGVRDAGYVVLLGQLGVSAAQAVAFSFCQLALIVVPAFIGAALVASGVHGHDRRS